MNDSWQPIYLSAKVFGHLSQGLYRTPAGAIKELISNSFDADAKLVRIHTGFPTFEIFSCEDDGTGVSRDEFLRLMNRGIGSSYKRTRQPTVTELLHRPLIGRLGLGILSLAQICTRFDILSHHKESKSAFKATIQFPPYTREEMDKIATQLSVSEEDKIHGGQYQIVTENFDASKQGVRIFTRYLREPFRKRMRSLSNLANRKVFGQISAYKTFESFLNAIYDVRTRAQSLNLLAEYDPILFGLALAAPLPFSEDRNVVIQVPLMRERQAQLRKFDFHVQVDNLSLKHPVCLPSDREGHTADRCSLAGSTTKDFVLRDGPVNESCSVIQHAVRVEQPDLQFNIYEVRYENRDVAGRPLEFTGYLFQQTGRLYPRDIQGVLIRLSNVAIGKYDNSMLTYPYAEGPRYSMVSSELFVRTGFEDALNIDRDSFNELHPHYIRVQSYVHSLLHDLIFPVTWSEEKERNRERRDAVSAARQSRFMEEYQKTTGDEVRSIQRLDKPPKGRRPQAPREAPVDFEARTGQIAIDPWHPLLQPLFRRRKYAPIVERVVVAFERANDEATAARRRELFYKLLAEIFSDL